MTELCRVCKKPLVCNGCGVPLERDDFAAWEHPHSYSDERGLCRMCCALGTPEEFLNDLFSPAERVEYNRLMKTMTKGGGVID